MLTPAIGKLINSYENRYQLVHDVANKAREIAQTAEDNREILVEKTVSLAINELAEQKGL